ncbi:GAF and ANTAR domain-containing protein [Plantactinospora sp. KBS50]|uniref:GAF and ANTAR domain-containing protein n=1 Tax=Plantactinospora sp. KBS50 TaxID=2024580 RepID=UPI001E36F2F0|nr:GAF and ANTAR domain-containing protein [Plantactinospora sp. KBS50]
MRTTTAPGDALGVLETAALLRELTAGLISAADFDEALAQLVRTCRAAVPGVTWCSVTILQAGEPASVAASDEPIRALDDVQYGDDGPAITAIRERDPVFVPDLAGSGRWPRWTARALALGVHGVVSAPVDIDDQVIGSINLYARRPGAFRDRQQLTAMLLAEHAGLLLAAVRGRVRADRAQPQPVAPGDEEVVGHALGVIMTQRGCPAPEAREVLRGASRALSIPLAELARRLVDSVARHHPG